MRLLEDAAWLKITRITVLPPPAWRRGPGACGGGSLEGMELQPGGGSL